MRASRAAAPRASWPWGPSSRHTHGTHLKHRPLPGMLPDMHAPHTIPLLSLLFPTYIGRGTIRYEGHTQAGGLPARHTHHFLWGKSPDTAAESASLKGQTLLLPIRWRRRPSGGAVTGAGGGDDRHSTVMRMAHWDTSRALTQRGLCRRGRGELRLSTLTKTKHSEKHSEKHSAKNCIRCWDEPVSIYFWAWLGSLLSRGTRFESARSPFELGHHTYVVRFWNLP